MSLFFLAECEQPATIAAGPLSLPIASTDMTMRSACGFEGAGLGVIVWLMRKGSAYAASSSISTSSATAITSRSA